jgi:AcrR family transcriptional regulator
MKLIANPTDNSASREVDRRAQILAAAARAFARKGYHATSVRAIAAEAGLAPGTLYLYFPSKRDLLTGFFDYALGSGESRLKDLVGLPLEQALLAMVTDRLELMHTHLGLLRVLLAESMFDPELARRVNQQALARVRELVERLLRGHGLSHLSPEQLTSAAQSLQALLFSEGVVLPSLDPEHPHEPVAAAHRIVAFALEGIRGMTREVGRDG